MAATDLHLTRNQRLVNRFKFVDPDSFVRLVHQRFAALLEDRPEPVDVRELLGDGGLLERNAQRPSLAATAQTKKFHLRRRRSSRGRKKYAQKTHCTIFGKPLTEAIVRQIYLVIKILNRTECLKVEGIFRKSGNATKQKQLQDILDCGEDVERQLEVNGGHVHDLACVLKYFLSQLPEPLLTERHIGAHYLAGEVKSEAKRIEMLQLMMLLLPSNNLTLLHHLLDLFRRIQEHEENRMNFQALAVIFAPSFMVDRNKTDRDFLDASSTAIPLVAFLFEKANVIFRIPEALMNDVTTCLENTVVGEGVRVSSVPKAVPVGKRNRILGKSGSDYAICSTSCSSYPTDIWNSIQSAPVIGSLESLAPQPQQLSDMRMVRKDSQDSLYCQPIGLSSPEISRLQKARTRSIGDTIKNLFRNAARKCKNAVQTPAHPHQLDAELDDSDVSPVATRKDAGIINDDDSLGCHVSSSHHPPRNTGTKDNADYKYHKSFVEFSNPRVIVVEGALPDNSRPPPRHPTSTDFGSRTPRNFNSVSGDLRTVQHGLSGSCYQLAVDRNRLKPSSLAAVGPTSYPKSIGHDLSRSGNRPDVVRNAYRSTHVDFGSCDSAGDPAWSSKGCLASPGRPGQSPTVVTLMGRSRKVHPLYRGFARNGRAFERRSYRASKKSQSAKLASSCGDVSRNQSPFQSHPGWDDIEENDNSVFYNSGFLNNNDVEEGEVFICNDEHVSHTDEPFKRNDEPSKCSFSRQHESPKLTEEQLNFKIKSLKCSSELFVPQRESLTDEPLNREDATLKCQDDDMFNCEHEPFSLKKEPFKNKTVKQNKELFSHRHQSLKLKNESFSRKSEELKYSDVKIRHERKDEQPIGKNKPFRRSEFSHRHESLKRENELFSNQHDQLLNSDEPFNCRNEALELYDKMFGKDEPFNCRNESFNRTDER